ncbi:hypothetical protein KC349_g4775 [Hortaea werneckii]|nr:hypothetical protein KC349_g4775 [Hortaea werneckii]
MFIESDLLDRVKNPTKYVQNPSRRTPNRETAFNDADSVERQLQADGHKIWGWVIYRCTYENDEEWAEFMRRLHFYNEKTLRFHNALDMQATLDYRVFEDRDRFDSMHPSAVLEHFTQWAATAPQQEQGESAYHWRSQRYNYCLHVDQEALQSVIGASAPPADRFGPGYVNLVCRKIIGGMRPEYTDDRANRDHCFMRINYQSLMVGWYSQLRPQGSWSNEYRIPPEVAKI